MTSGPTGSACRAVSRFWDGVVEDFLAGREIEGSLRRWKKAYRGQGAGAVQKDALPELFLGPLSRPRGVFLALNPGRACPSFHARDGKFAREIRGKYGSYSKWAESWPYFRDPWLEVKRRNAHHFSRLRFLRRWTGEEGLCQSAMVSFELYPWHSARFSGRLVGDVAREFFVAHIRDALVELDAPVFAFGARWFPILRHPDSGLEVDEWLNGDRRYGSHVESRRAMVLRGEGGLEVVAVKQRGYAGPPSCDETRRLRDAVTGTCP